MSDSTTQGVKTVLHPVSDLKAAKAVYAALLGVEATTDTEYYVGFESAGQQIGLVPGGAGDQDMTSPVAYWAVSDIEAKLADLTAAGATVKEPAHDVGAGRLVQPSPTPTATSSVCIKINEGPPLPRRASPRHRSLPQPHLSSRFADRVRSRTSAAARTSGGTAGRLPGSTSRCLSLRRALCGSR